GGIPAGPSSTPVPRTDNRKLLLGIIAGGFLLLLFSSLGLTYFLSRTSDPVNSQQAALSPNGSRSTSQPGNDNRTMGDPPAADPRNRLTQEEQQQVDKAIEKGVDFLKSTQNPDGWWNSSLGGGYTAHPIGYAALPGLTLLECGAPASDPHIQNAASVVR